MLMLLLLMLSGLLMSRDSCHQRCKNGVIMIMIGCRVVFDYDHDAT